jgi:hypothetical protein
MNSASRQLLTALAVSLLAATTPMVSLARTESSSDSLTIETFPMGFSPWDLAFDGANIWTNNFFGSSVVKVRASDGVILATYYPGYEPRSLAFDGASIWVGNEVGDVTKLRASDGKIEATIDLGSSAIGHILFDGQNIWVASWGGGSVVFKLQPSDGTILGT